MAPQQGPTPLTTLIVAASDAGARIVDGQIGAYLGGWYSVPRTSKRGTHWFYIQICPAAHPWAYESDNPARPGA